MPTKEEVQIAFVLSAMGINNADKVISKTKEEKEEAAALNIVLMQVVGTMNAISGANQKMINSFKTTPIDKTMKDLGDKITPKIPKATFELERSTTKKHWATIASELPETPFKTLEDPELVQRFFGRSFLKSSQTKDTLERLPSTPEIRGNTPIMGGVLGKRNIYPKQQTIINKTMEKFNKGLKDLTKQTFMLQMGMLGVAFSSQALISSFQSMAMSGLAGLADTETAIKNMVLSDTFAGTDFMKNLNMDEFIKNSLLAKGAIAAFQSILVDIFNKVFSNKGTADNIKNAIITLVTELTKPEFIAAVTGIVAAITKPEFVKSLTDAALQIANLTNQLGEAGLLDKIILLIVACQFLMPVFAAAQLALLIIQAGFGAVAATIAGVAFVILFVIGIIVNSFNEFKKSGDYIQSIIYGIIDTFGALVDFFGGMMNILFKWTGQFNYVQGSFEKQMKYKTYGSNDFAELQGTTAETEKLKTEYNNYIFNKNVSTQEAAELIANIKSSRKSYA